MIDCISRLFKKPSVLVVGADGMLGKEVVRMFQAESLKSKPRIKKCIGFGRADLELGKFSDKFSTLCHEHSVDVVVNCAAFADTTKCEDKDYLQKSYEANVLGVQMLAGTCAYCKIKFVHVSTDYVYSQYSYRDDPWIFDFPCNMYGMQKLLAEEKIHAIYSSWPEGQLICRMSWLYGNTKKNLFMHKILSMAYAAKAKAIQNNEKEAAISVVSDQIGAPQTAKEAAQKIVNLVCENVYGTVNCWSKDQLTNRAKFAQQIIEAYADSIDCRLKDVQINACNSSDFKSAVQHPLFKVHAPLPTGYLSSNASFCNMRNIRKFSKMVLKVDRCLDVPASAQNVSMFIAGNNDLMQHVMSNLDGNVKQTLEKISCIK